jgi:hypothetical protein
MELLGREMADVVSVACSSSSPTAFATLSGQGTLTLWDLRLKRKNYLSLPNPNHVAKTEATELRFYHDRHAAIALCGNTVQLYDTRKSLSVLAEYVHPKECVAFLKTPPPATAETTLIVDEDGGMFPFCIRDGTRQRTLEAYILGKPCTLPPGQDVLGDLNNYCSGLHCVDVSSSGNDGAEAARVLFAVGMDGHGALHRCADLRSSTSDGGAVQRIPFNIMEAPQERQKEQLVNPPLVNYTTLCHAMLAVGRADGTYTVYNVERDGLEALLEAPGHAVNGLCYVDWLSPEVLITTSICGEVTGWNVGSFLAAADDDGAEDEEGDLPEVVAAFTHREVPGCQLATLNCGDRLSGGSSYVFGDHLGGVTLARVEL